jgi:hypothetical protein
MHKAMPVPTELSWVKVNTAIPTPAYLPLLPTADHSLWKATKQLKQPTQRIPPIRSADQTWARSDREKANTFAGHLEKTFKPNELPQNEVLEIEINKALKEPLQITTNQISYTKGNSKHNTRRSQPKESTLI